MTKREAVEKFLDDFGVSVPDGAAPIVVEGAALLTLGRFFATDARFGPAHPMVGYLAQEVADVVIKGRLAAVPSGAARPRSNRAVLTAKIVKMMCSET